MRHVMLSMLGIMGACGGPDLTLQAPSDDLADGSQDPVSEAPFVDEGDDDFAETYTVETAAEWSAATQAGGLVIEAEAPFAQLGYLIDGPDAFGLEYRLDPDEAWRPLPITWAEEGAAVGRVMVDPDDPGAQADWFALRGPSEALTFATIQLYDAWMADPELLARDLPVESSSPLERSAALPSWMVSRAGWGARSPGKLCGSAHTPRRITIHHTATANQDSLSPAARMRQMQAFHIDSLGWCDLGYHFVVGIDGRVYQGRNNEGRTGAHVANHNRDNVGVSLVGNFVSFEPREVQMEGAARALGWIHQRYGIALTRNQVKGHQEYMATACPGARMMARMGELLQRARGNTAPPSSTPEPPAAVVGALVGFVREGSIHNADAPVAGATVRLVGAARNATTDARGFYRFNDLPLATYQVQVDATGFQRATTERTVDQRGQDHYASVALERAGGSFSTEVSGVNLSTLTPFTPHWERLGDGSWKLWSDAPAGAAEVRYYVDGWRIGSSDRAFNQHEIRHRFSQEAESRRFDAVAFNASGAPIGWAFGAIDVGSGPGVVVRRTGARTYHISLERVPWVVQGMEVQVDGWTLTDQATSASRVSPSGLTYRFSSVGQRAFVVHTYNGDGSYRGTLRRTLTLEE